MINVIVSFDVEFVEIHLFAYHRNAAHLDHFTFSYYTILLGPVFPGQLGLLLIHCC